MSNNSKTQERLSFERRALSIEETAESMRLEPRDALSNSSNQKKLGTLKIGSRRLVPVGAIDALLSGGAQ